MTREYLLFPESTNLETQFDPEASRAMVTSISGDTAMTAFDSSLGKLQLDDAETGLDLPGIYHRGSWRELDDQGNEVNLPVISFLYNKKSRAGELEAEERLVILRGFGYGSLLPDHKGQPPTWYLIGADIGKVDHQTGQITTLAEPGDLKVKNFSVACINDGPLGQALLANPESFAGKTEVTTASLEDLDSLTAFLQPVYATTYPNRQGITSEMFKGEAFWKHLRTYLEGQLTNSDISLLVARHGEQVVGTIGLEVDPAKPGTGAIWGFYTDPRLHGKGLGRTLWAELMNSKAAKNLQEFRLFVARNSTDAIRFYEHNGFVKVGKEKWNWPSWTDEHPVNHYWLMARKSAL